MKTPKLDSFQRALLKTYAWLLSLGLLYALWIRITGLGIPCFLYTVTGIQCPGCGISRMFLAMLRLDFGAAFQYNPVTFCLFFFWNLVSLLGFWGKPAFARNTRFLYGCLWGTMSVLVVFGIVRLVSAIL